MINSFNKYLKSITPDYNTAKYLLAVSGGIDSMLMLWLFKKSGLNFTVANINFNLRGKEADMDSKMVIDFCNNNNINILHKGFDTNAYSKENKISTQMAARDIRYQWFDELAEEFNFDYISIAHHLDDQSETFFINLIRGTGIAGLHGLARNKNKIIRPLMFCTRDEIAAFVEKNNIPFREDSSNSSDKYQRNYIRHHILPQFYSLQENFSKKLDNTIEYISELEEYANEKLKKDVENIITETDAGLFMLNIEKILKHSQPKLLCYKIFSDYGFGRNHIDDLMILLEKDNSGKILQSSKHILLIERNNIILKVNTVQNDFTQISISGWDDTSWNEIGIKIYTNSKEDYKRARSNQAFIDADKVVFPLVVRNWQKGDFFHPFGMKGIKKLSDFFIDNKFTNYQKQNTLLLCDNESIIWVIGHRIDNKYAITKNTNNIIKLEHNGNN
jgi:tRNA(Ile)-lysidine synthase